MVSMSFQVSTSNTLLLCWTWWMTYMEEKIDKQSAQCILWKVSCIMLKVLTWHSKLSCNAIRMVWTYSSRITNAPPDQNRSASSKEQLFSYLNSYSYRIWKNCMRSTSQGKRSITTIDSILKLYNPYLTIPQYGFKQKGVKYQELLFNKLQNQDLT